MNSISKFHTEPFIYALKAFFEELKVPVDYLADEPASAADILGERYKANNEAHQLMDDVFALGMVNDAIFEGTETFKNLEEVQQLKADYDGLLLFGVTLKNRKDGLPITRSHLAEITRAFNRTFPYTPVTIIFKYSNLISFANSERIPYKQEWREGEKIGKVTMLKDIDTEQPHTGHIKILLDLKITHEINSFNRLYQYWQKVLDVNILNKKFFQDLSNWYFWAMDNVSFPDDLEKKKEIRNATNLIRLITRVVFIWFIKEKSLVPNALFNKSHLDKILKDFNKNKKSQNYYHAILQNLFFGTLNQKMEERKFAKDGGNIKTNGEEYGVKNLFRHADLFTIPEKEILALFQDVPFLNGGLFDCLDKPNEEGKIVYVDGFSRNPKKQAVVPDDLFFGEEREIDLNDIFATKNKKYKSRGLINLLESYKFTVDENTPIEEEIALDPELLGKVFENLLASYNPETQTTARKQTGSFYTPREIVNYMADESLLEYIKQNVKNNDSDFETRLRELISYSETLNPFDEAETKALIEAINNCKILDPACGSGAYPMGILHKMVHLLQKLDPENKYWREIQEQKAIEETKDAFKIGDQNERALRLKEISDVFENNASDYGRKLYLIENCIYGIDIQPIAVQISKLRFFISLIIDQNKQASKENFGIRSLPNLETKFVAANTLIGLDKPSQTLLRNPDIEVKENQLKELRHKYFTANTRKEKLQYQKQDKKLRQEIAKMLESDGWQTEVAKQIVAFDPYDQNTFANWFDPEWMFGLTSGFDIVIGNPPYGAKLDNKPLYKKLFPKTSFGNIDSYKYFIDKGIQLSNNNGSLCFITSDSFLEKEYFEDIRKLMLETTSNLHLIKLGENIFENVSLPTAIFHSVISKKKTTPIVNISNWTDQLFDYNLNLEIKKSEILRFLETDKSFSFSIKKTFFDFTDTINLIDIYDQVMGVKIYQVGKGIPKQTKFEFENNVFVSDKRKGEEWMKFIDSGVKRYSLESPERYIKYGKWLAEPRDIKYFTQPKILIREIINPRVFATYTDESCCVKNTIAVVIQKDKHFSLKYLLAIINSNFFSFYMSEKAPKSANKLFPSLSSTLIKNFPIKKTNTNHQNSFSIITEYILLFKKQNQDSIFFEHLIDAMVYELYLPEEIKAGGAEVLKHLGNLPELKEGQDEQNLKTIEKVYKELSDPKHPISAALLKLLTIEEVNIIEGRK